MVFFVFFFFSIEKHLAFLEPSSLKKALISIYCLCSCCSLCSLLQNSPEKPGASPATRSSHASPGHVWARENCRCHLTLCTLSVATGLQGHQSVRNTELTAASITAVPQAAWSCRALGRAAEPVLPHCTHRAPSSTAPAAAAALSWATSVPPTGMALLLCPTGGR